MKNEQHARFGSQLAAATLANAVYAMKNFPIMLINTILSPFGFLLVIFFVSRGALLQVGILGALIMTMVNSGVSLQGDLTHLKNDIKLQDMLVSSPVSAQMYIGGMALSELVFSAPTIAVLAILAGIFIHVSLIAALTIIGAMLMTFIFSVSLGFFISTISYDVIQGWAFMGLVQILFSTLPPVYYLITYIPLPFRYLAYLSPTTYAAEIVQHSIGFLPLSAFTAALNWVILIIVSASLFVFAVKKSRWVQV